MAHRAVGGLGRGARRNAEGACGESAEEGPATADTAQGDFLLGSYADGRVMPGAAIRHVALDEAHIPPFVVVHGDDIRSVNAKHLAEPGEVLVAVFGVRDEPALPGVHVLEGRIQFTVEVSLFVVEVAFDLVDVRLCRENDPIHPSLSLVLRREHRSLRARFDSGIALQRFGLGLQPRHVDGGAEG